MIKIIYDFDGTITKSPNPTYGYFELCDIPTNLDEQNQMIRYYMNKYNLNMYKAYFKMVFEHLNKNNIPANLFTFSMGVEDIEYTPGIKEFLKEQEENYILTSGYAGYIRKSAVGPLVKEVYGTEYKYVNGLATGVKTYMTDKDKSKMIDKIADNKYKNIVYIGDGLTDYYALKRVAEKGGTAILLHRSKDNIDLYNKLVSEKIKVEYFEADFRKRTELYKFIKNLKNKKLSK